MARRITGGVCALLIVAFGFAAVLAMHEFAIGANRDGIASVERRLETSMAEIRESLARIETALGHE